MNRLGKTSNIVILDRYDCAFIGIPKSANSSIKLRLAHFLLKIQQSQNSATLGQIDRSKLHLRKGGYLQYISPKELNGQKPRLVFSCIRNPYTRILSCYRNKVKNSFHKPFQKYGFNEKMSFFEFLKEINQIDDNESEIHFRSQYAQLTYKGSFLANYIMRMESIDVDWQLVQKFLNSLGGDILPLPKINASPIDRPRHVFTKMELDVIEERFSKDIIFFSYPRPECEV